jgi:hypothetical protein
MILDSPNHLDYYDGISPYEIKCIPCDNNDQGKFATGPDPNPKWDSTGGWKIALCLECGYAFQILEFEAWKELNGDEEEATTA